ncbi:MAG: transposase [Acidimicrobiia bacterium]|nr:transposase [Acidimicrobiia bacterium]MYG59986.1 transposase [Acidimicrobiia bacterium]MYJ33686.1 transposase [Acidimicrobiia bacterium]
MSDRQWGLIAPLLPSECFGKWNTLYRRFRRWAASGVFARVLSALDSQLGLGTAMVEGMFVKAHQNAPGAKDGQP